MRNQDCLQQGCGYPVYERARYNVVRDVPWPCLQVVKQFRRRAASRGGVDFCGGQCNVIPTSREDCSGPLWHYWRLNDPFRCIHHSRDSKCFSMGRTTPQNCSIQWGLSTPPNTWFLRPTCRISPQTASRSVQPFLQGTHKTDRPRYERHLQPYIGRICAMQPKMHIHYIKHNTVVISTKRPRHNAPRFNAHYHLFPRKIEGVGPWVSWACKRLPQHLWRRIKVLTSFCVFCLPLSVLLVHQSSTTAVSCTVSSELCRFLMYPFQVLVPCGRLKRLPAIFPVLINIWHRRLSNFPLTKGKGRIRDA